jgi:hypothetical protein
MLGLRGQRSHETHAPADAMAEVVRRQARPLAPAACLVTGSSLRPPLALSLRARGRPPTQRKQKWAACERGSAKTKLYGSMYRREIPEHAFVPSQPVEWLHCRHSQPELTGSNSPDRSLWPCHNVSLHLLHHPGFWRGALRAVATLPKTAQTRPARPRHALSIQSICWLM